MSDSPARVAVLIDCDNISHTLAGRIMAEAASYGTLGVKRAYGDCRLTASEVGALP